MCLLKLCIIITILFYADTTIVEQPTELPNVNLKHKIEAQKSDIGNSTKKLQASPKSSNQVKIFFKVKFGFICILKHHYYYSFYYFIAKIPFFKTNVYWYFFLMLQPYKVSVSLRVVKNFEVKNCIPIFYYFVYCVLCRYNRIIDIIVS